MTFYAKHLRCTEILHESQHDFVQISLLSGINATVKIVHLYSGICSYMTAKMQGWIFEFSNSNNVRKILEGPNVQALRRHL